jgi:hypothetical protein
MIFHYFPSGFPKLSAILIFYADVEYRLFGRQHHSPMREVSHRALSDLFFEAFGNGGPGHPGALCKALQCPVLCLIGVDGR